MSKIDGIIAESLRYAEERGIISSNGKYQERWQLLTLQDALQDREPLQQVITGFVKPGLITVFGAPGALKSMLLADLAICVASGKPWLQPLHGGTVDPVPVQQNPVLWIDFDNGTRRTLDRFKALAKGHNVQYASIGIYSMPVPRLNASAADSVARLAERIHEFRAGLVIIDNLGLIAGVDENSADMASAMGNLRWLAEETGACIVLIHHQRKTSPVKARTGETLRGHSSIEAALDAAVLVEREDGRTLVSLKATKSRDVPMRPLAALFSFEHKLGTSELESARFWGVVAAEASNTDSDIEAALLAQVGEQRGINQSALVKAVKTKLEVGEKRIRAILQQLVRSGKLKETVGKRGARCYRLP